MSKATILENLKDGLYKIRLQIDYEPVRQRLLELDTFITASNILLNETLIPAEAEKFSELNAIAVPDDLQPSAAADALMKRLYVARAAYDKARKAVEQEKISREQYVSEKGKLLTVEEFQDVVRWCGDYNTELEVGQEVGIIDYYRINEPNPADNQNIVPAMLDSPNMLYEETRDGRNFPQLALGTWSWWLNMMTGPLLERFDPLYRKAIITAKNANGTVNIAVDDFYSQAAPVGAAELTGAELNLDNVPVQYLTCDALPFDVDDRVIVEYPRQNLPKIQADLFASEKTALTEKLAAQTVTIAALDANLAALQIELDQLQQAIETKNAALLDEEDANGIKQLKLDIEQLESELDTLRAQTREQTQARDNALADISQLTEQLNKAQQELDALIANNAPAEDIDAKAAEVAELFNQIGDATTAESVASYALASLAIDNDAKTAERDQKHAELLAKTAAITTAETDLQDAIAAQAEKIKQQSAIEQERNAEKLYSASIETKIDVLADLIDVQRGREQQLKAYTDLRPKQITVIGFESRPKRCGGNLYFFTNSNTLAKFSIDTGTIIKTLTVPASAYSKLAIDNQYNIFIILSDAKLYKISLSKLEISAVYDIGYVSLDLLWDGDCLCAYDGANIKRYDNAGTLINSIGVTGGAYELVTFLATDGMSLFLGQQQFIEADTEYFLSKITKSSGAISRISYGKFSAGFQPIRPDIFTNGALWAVQQENFLDGSPEASFDLKIKKISNTSGALIASYDAESGGELRGIGGFATNGKTIFYKVLTPTEFPTFYESRLAIFNTDTGAISFFDSGNANPSNHAPQIVVDKNLYFLNVGELVKFNIDTHATQIYSLSVVSNVVTDSYKPAFPQFL